MCSVAHVAAGAIVGSLVGNHLLAFCLGLASHIPLDLIPHFDFKDYRADAALTAALLAVALIGGGLSPLLFGALGAVVPDVENLLWKMGIIGEKHKVFPTHSGLLEHGRATRAGGATTEIIVSVLSAAAVLLAVLIGGGAS